MARRVDRARGALLARTGRSILWADIGRAFDWHSSTASEAKAGRRPLRVAEIGEIARLLECSPGWLAFGEGAMESTNYRDPTIPFEDESAATYLARQQRAEAHQVAEKQPPAKKRRPAR